jgi:hypothetical protein
MFTFMCALTQAHAVPMITYFNAKSVYINGRKIFILPGNLPEDEWQAFQKEWEKRHFLKPNNIAFYEFVKPCCYAQLSAIIRTVLQEGCRCEA